MSKDLISPEYQELLMKKVHKEPHWGGTGFRHSPQVIELINEYECTTWIDYGCGNESLRANLNDLKVRIAYIGYDPSRLGKHRIPTTPADLVTCIDVMEHVEEDRVPNVLRNIRELTKTVAYFLISSRKAVHMLPDGTNAHLTLKPAGWWEKQLRKHYSSVTVERLERDDMRVVCLP